MPVMSGFNLSRKMLKLQQKKEQALGITQSKFTIVALTGHVDDKVEEEAYEIGMKDVINKPLKYHDCERVVAEHFKRVV